MKPFCSVLVLGVDSSLNASVNLSVQFHFDLIRIHSQLINVESCTLRIESTRRYCLFLVAVDADDISLLPTTSGELAVCSQQVVNLNRNLVRLFWAL